MAGRVSDDYSPVARKRKRLHSGRMDTSLPTRLLTLAACYRAAHLFAHQCHWIVTSPTFKQDHDLFAEFYAAYADATDNLVELAIGFDGVSVYDPEAFHEQVFKLLRPALRITKREGMLHHLQAIEKQVQASLESLNAQQVPLGVGDVLQTLAGASTHRAYLVRGFLEA